MEGLGGRKGGKVNVDLNLKLVKKNNDHLTSSVVLSPFSEFSLS